MVATAARVRPLRNRDTSQPTSAISGRASPTIASTIHSAVVGVPGDLDVVAAGDQVDRQDAGLQRRVRRQHRGPTAARAVATGRAWSAPTANRALGTSFQPRRSPMLGGPVCGAKGPCRVTLAAGQSPRAGRCRDCARGIFGRALSSRRPPRPLRRRRSPLRGWAVAPPCAAPRRGRIVAGPRL